MKVSLVVTCVAGAALLSLVPGSPAPQRLEPPARPHATQPTHVVPRGLRETVSATVGASRPRYHAHHVGAAVKASGGGVASTFTRSGVKVKTRGHEVSFSVRGLGTATNPVTRGNRVTYRHGNVREWYVNGPLGLEQGFTFAKSPSSGDLAVTQILGGELAPRQVGQTILFGSSGATLRYSELRAFDADNHPLPARMRLAGRALTLSVDATGARYPVTIDPLIQQGAKLVPSNASGNGRFGFSVALTGDGNTALVGAPEETPSDVAGAGAAWIFTRSGTTWTEQKKLVPNGEILDGRFGSSVALSDDNGGVITALVGAPNDDNNTGAVWVFTGAGSDWTERTKLVPKVDEVLGFSGAGFGTSVALSNAGTTALIGGPTDNNFAGAAWVFTGTGSDWPDHQKLIASDETDGFAQFGSSVAVSGDGTTALVGGPSDKGNDGGAWASTQSNGTFPTPTKLPLPDNITQFAEFGTSVGLSDDGHTALIGAPYGNGGAAWIYTNGGSWTQGAALSPDDASGSELFGWSVALSGDAGTALVSGPDDGAAWVFRAPEWKQDGTKRLPGEQTFGNFGWSVAVSHDGTTALFGEPDNAASNHEGAAWPFAAVTGNEVNTYDDALPSPTECSGQPGDCSLRQAIDHAQPGDTILVPPGIYTLSIPTTTTGGGALALSKSLTIKGEGSKSEAVMIEDGGSFDDRLIRVTGDSTDVTLTGLTLTGSTKGAIENAGGTLTLTEDAISFSFAAAGSAILSSGGRVFVGGAGEAGITVVDNDSTGGAIQLSGGSMTLSNSTIVDNGAIGVYNTGGLATLTNVTLDRNFPASLRVEASGVTHIRNTVIGANTVLGSVGCTGTKPTSDGSNMDADGSCVVAGGSDSPNEPIDQYFAPLADNGGPTQTEALLWGPAGGTQNPGIDAGYPCPDVDQRGFTRGTSCDIGAVAATPPELGSDFPTATTVQAQDYNGTTALLPGTINLGGEAGAYYFEWGTSQDSLPNRTPLRAMGVLGSNTSVDEFITGLQPAHHYFFRVVAVNATAAVRGNASEFLTPISDRYVNASWAGTAPGADPDGNGPATAFLTDSFATIHDAVDAANGGDPNTSIHVEPGTYTETTLDLTQQGLRLFGVGGSDATHLNLTTLQIDADDVTVSGLDLAGPNLTLATTTEPVVNIRSGNDVVIHSNKITGGRIGVDLGSTTGSEVLVNEITANVFAVVLSSSANSNDIFENDIHDNGNSSSSNGGQSAILVDGATNTWIFGNTIAKSVNDGVSVRGSATTIQSNTISGSGAAYPLFPESAGIDVSAQAAMISGNTITGSAFAGIRLDAPTPGAVLDTRIEGNTITGTLHGGADGSAAGPNSGGAAILITQGGAGDSTITNNQLSSNSGWGILQTNSSGNSANNVAHQNNIVGNVRGGVENRASLSFDAVNNWWGAADGPSGVGPGHGDAVSTGVAFNPWATSAFQPSQNGTQLTGQAGSPVSGVLAQGQGCATSATIFWGDGTSDTATPACQTQFDVLSFTVSGTHTYAEPETYAILVQTDRGNFTAQALISAPPPANDDWGNATALTSATSGSASGSNVGATTEAGERLTLNGVPTGKTVWWKWTAPSTGTIVFNTTGSSFDTVLGVFTGSSLSALSLVASGDDGGGGVTSEVAFSAASGTTYYIQVGSFANGSSGSISLAWGPPPPAPANDDWANAATLRSVVPAAASGLNVGATTEQGEPLSLVGGTSSKTVWWKWSAPATGTFVLDTIGSSFDTVLGVFTGTSVSALTEVASDDDSGGGGGDSLLALHATGGTVYYVQVGSSVAAPAGTIALHAAQASGPTVTNEEATNITSHSAVISASIDPDGLLTTVEIEYGLTSSYGQKLTPTASESTPFTMSVQVGGLAAGTEYHYRVNATNANGTTNGADTTFTTTAVPALSISKTPASQTIDSGGTASFTITVMNTGEVDLTTVAVTDELTPDCAKSVGTLTVGQSSTYNCSATNVTAGFTNVASVSGHPATGADVNASASADVTVNPPPAVAPSVSGQAAQNVTASDATLAASINPNGSATTYVIKYGTTSDYGQQTSAAAVGSGTGDVPVSQSVGGLTANTTYHFQFVATNANGTTAGPDATFTTNPPPPPANDNFTDAAVLSGESGDVPGSTANATTEQGEPTSVPFPGGDRPGANSVWYRWQSRRNGTLTVQVSVLGTSSGLVEVYRGPASGATFADLAHVDGETHASTQVLSAPVTQGQTYYVQVMSDVISEGNPNFNFTLSRSFAGTGATTYQVTATTDDVNDANCLVSSCTLRQAVNAANAGTGSDTVNVPAGSYQLSGNFGAVVVSKGMSILGAGARSTTVLGPPLQRVFDVTSAANSVLIQGFKISGGTATATNGSFGGNVRSSGVLTLLEDAIVNGSAQSGGGVSNNAGTLVIDRSTVSGNTALSGGGDSGGVQNFGSGTSHGVLTIRNSTITNNSARLGGGVFSWGDTANTTTIENSTIAFNSATDRGIGGIGGDGTFTFKSTIVSNNTFGVPSNCSGSITSLGNNLESGTDCGFTGPGDIQSTDPQLGLLSDNGGPTNTRALTGTSPAFDHISSGCPPPATDQRGVSRPQGSACDIGAYEGVAPAAQAPSVSGQAAQSVTDTSATLLANVNPNGSATTYVINFGTSASYGQQTSPADVGSGSTAQLVSQAFSNLTPSTTYHFQFVATNAGGTTPGPDMTFTTNAPPPPPTTPPSVAGGITQSVTDTSATVQADIHPNGSATTYVVEYGTSANYGQQTPQTALNSPTAEQVASQALANLAPSTTYHFRFVATNAGGTTTGSDATLTTGPQLAGTSGSQVSGTLASGIGCPASATINWGDGSPSDAGTVSCQGAAAPTFTVSGSHTYAAAGTYSIVVTIAGGATYGAGAVIAAASSPGSPPTIAGQAAQNLTDTGATVVATINPNGAATTYLVKYGTSSSYGQQTAPVAIGSGSSLQSVSQALTGLAANTTYHFQFVATNANGTTSGPDSTFTTAAAPQPQPAPQGPPQETTTQTTTTTTTTTGPAPPAGPLPGVLPPVEDVAVDVLPLTGTVLVNGQPLLVGQQIPLGAIVDATNGTVVLFSVVNGVIQRMEFAGAIFQVFQLPDGTTQLVLTGGDFSVCASFKPPTVKVKPSKKKAKGKTSTKATRRLAAARQAQTVRALWGNGQGSFQTKGRYAAATVRGTIYYVADRCDGTITRVERGVVSVHDDVLNKNVTVNAGESYLAKAKK